MAIYTVYFRRLLSERKEASAKSVSAKTNVKLVELEKESDNTVKVKFIYQTQYEPDFGLIEIAGDLYYSSEKDEIKKLVETWDKDKKIEDEASLKMLNHIFSKCSIEAALLAKETNLPVPFNLPKFRKREE